MRTKITIILFIAIAFIAGCQKEEGKISTAPLPPRSVVVDQPSDRTSNCWHYTVTALVPCETCQSGWALVPSYTVYCCGTGCASSIAGHAALTMPNDTSSVVGSGPSVAFASGIKMKVYSGTTLVATVYSNDNGEFNFSGITAGTYNLHESRTGYYDKSYPNVVLPITTPTLFPLDKQ